MPPDPVRYVLDSFALLAYLEDEPGRDRVQALLEQAERGKAQIWLSIVNLGEIVYITEREQGLTQAQKVIAAIDQLPLAVVDVDRPLTFAAAHWKAKHPIAYADAFAVALAVSLEATLLTGDPELKAVEDQVEIEWLATKKGEGRS